MAKQSINVGATANDKKGDSLRAAFQKVNANFTELYTALGLAADADLNLGNFVFESNTVRLTNATNNDSTATQIEIAQPVRIESDLTVGGDVVPNTANGGDLGSAAKPWKSLYVSNSTIYIGGTAVGVDGNGNLTTGGTVVGNTPAWDNVTGKPTFAAVATSGAYIDLTGILEIDIGVHEKFQTKANATGTVTHDCALGHIFYHTSPDANWTANFTNLNLSTIYATSLTLIIVQGATGYYPSAVQIGGAAQTINWQGNVNPTVSSSRTDVVTFSIINNSGTYIVLGQLTGF